jgi:hypothetical protein
MRDEASGKDAQAAGGDGRLRELLAVETRLQKMVRAAEERAARQIAAAREARDRRLVEAREAAARADEARSREERVAHEQALAAIERDHRATLAAIEGLSDERIEELARWVVDQVIGASGETV